MNTADEILVETSKRLVPADPALVLREWLLAYLASRKLSSFEVLLSICRASPRSSSELQVRNHKTTRNSITSSPETSRIDLDTRPICAKPQPLISVHWTSLGGPILAFRCEQWIHPEILGYPSASSASHYHTRTSSTLSPVSAICVSSGDDVIRALKVNVSKRKAGSLASSQPKPHRSTFEEAQARRRYSI